MVTKDSDFRASHLVSGSPRRLLLVTTGNTTNPALLALFGAHLPAIVEALDEVRFVEVGPEQLIVHEDR